jgi:anti-sigma regulatory factor (Ser/Thr protein kinase)
MPDQARARQDGDRRAATLFGRPGSFRLSLAPDSLAPKRARSALTELDVGLDPAVRERSSVVLSELITNCIKHAGLGGSERIDVEFSIRPELVRLEVTDPGDGFEIVALEPGRDDGTGGWGFWLIEQMTDRWGVDFSHSTNVWCEFDRA